MSHFSFDNIVTDLTRLDGPLQAGPSAKWQRKGSLALGGGGGLSPRSARTPGLTPGILKSDSGKATKTPGKTPGNGSPSRSSAPQQRGRWKTPSKNSSSPTKGTQQDRFIPNRATSDFDAAAFALTRSNATENETAGPPNAEYQKQLSAAMSVSDDQKVLSYKENKPKPADEHPNNLQVIYSRNKVYGPGQGPKRNIPKVPERILDAPELMDDYYLNLLDWSSNNHVAVALGASIYIWDAGSGSITQLATQEAPNEYMSAVSWLQQGTILGVGNSQGQVELWDVASQKRIRTMAGHAARVGSLSWNAHILSSGSRSGAIHHHDVRVAEHCVGVLSHHTQDVCGLSWSPDGRYLASGGNDNVLNIWRNTLGEGMQPLWTLTQHQAAVKALSWCPWQPSVLASGGGTADRNIRLWNINYGNCLNSVDANSQVCAVLWSPVHKELISGHGFSQNQLSIWKYPELSKVIDLESHKSRVLNLAMSPDGTMVASAAADETVRIWNCFAADKKKKSTIAKLPKGQSETILLKASNIR